MKTFLILGMTIVAALFAGCIFEMNDDYEKDSSGGKTFTISGKFTNNSGTAIAGLTVVLDGEAKATALTDDKGEYSFGNIAVGSYTVTPGDSGYGPKSIVVTNKDFDLGTNNKGHGSNIAGDYTCSKCHK